MAADVRYVFGPFDLHGRTHQLRRDGEPLAVGDRQAAVLVELVARPGDIVSKDALMAAVWPDVHVTENSLEQAISLLRRLLGERTDGGPYVETVPRRGYRFTAAVTRQAPRASEQDLDALLAPHRRWVEGRAALETLAADQVGPARAAFEQVLAGAPDSAAAHVGLANACAMQFETTRADPEPDTDALRVARTHAREACRLDPALAEAWATLGFVLARTGEAVDALAAARRATALEPDNWRHHVRLASTAWGEERLRAARRALDLLPGLGLAHWLAATVFVARQAFDKAEAELDAGLAAQAAPHTPARFSGVGLAWLRGLLHLASSQPEAALVAFERELASEAEGHIYGRECGANVWHAIGSLHLAQGDHDAAARAYRQALARVPGHLLAHVGLAMAAPLTPAGPPMFTGIPAHVDVPRVEMALARAAAILWAGRPDEAARLVGRALDEAPAGNAGWVLPVEPLLRPWIAREAWGPVLARLRTRAA